MRRIEPGNVYIVHYCLVCFEIIVADSRLRLDFQSSEHVVMAKPLPQGLIHVNRRICSHAKMDAHIALNQSGSKIRINKLVFIFFLNIFNV